VKKLLCAAFGFFFAANSFAKSPDAFDLLFMRNHMAAGFELPFLITNYGDHRGAGDLRLRTLPGFAIKAEYTYNFNKYIGFTSGLKTGVQVFGFEVTAAAGDFSMPEDISRNYFQMIPFFSIPLTVTPRILFSKGNIIQAEFGAAAIFFTEGTSENAMSYRNGVDTEQIFLMKTYYSASPQFALHAGLSYQRVLRSGNIFKAGPVYNYARRAVIDGRYSFHKDDVVVGNGNVFSSFSYFAIEITCIFTRMASLVMN
jgi:hypothetical protein